MSTWSGIRNKLENDYLCPALRGRIQYFATSYWESHDQTGRAAIRLDGVVSSGLQWRGERIRFPDRNKRSVGAVRQRQRGEGRGKHLAAG